jgi:hypothetical protein
MLVVNLPHFSSLFRPFKSNANRGMTDYRANYYIFYEELEEKC